MQSFNALRTLTGLGVLVAVALGLLALAWLFQRRLIYLPLERSVPPAAELLPGAADARFETADGLRLGGWFLPPAEPARRTTVLVFNGNAGNRAARAPLAARLAERGVGVMLFDYRGYGDNPGRPSEEGLIADARAARAWLGRRSGLDTSRIVYYGESLGAAVALALAVEQPPAALILRSPFTSMTDVGRLHYPVLPVRWLLRDRWSSIDRVERLRSPLLVIGGGRDGIVPVAQSRMLFEAAPGAANRFVLFEQAGHNDYELLAGPRLIETIMNFLFETGAPPADRGEGR